MFNFKIVKVTDQVIAIHILHNISRSKGNQAMKFGLLIKYSVRRILLQKSYGKFHFQKGGLDRTSNLMVGLLGKRGGGGRTFSGGFQFLKYLMTKKCPNKNIFSVKLRMQTGKF